MQEKLLAGVEGIIQRFNDFSLTRERGLAQQAECERLVVEHKATLLALREEETEAHSALLANTPVRGFTQVHLSLQSALDKARSHEDAVDRLAQRRCHLVAALSQALLSISAAICKVVSLEDDPKIALLASRLRKHMDDILPSHGSEGHPVLGLAKTLDIEPPALAMTRKQGAFILRVGPESHDDSVAVAGEITPASGVGPDEDAARVDRAWVALMQVFPQLFAKVHVRSKVEWARCRMGQKKDRTTFSRWLKMHANTLKIRYRNLQNLRTRQAKGVSPSVCLSLQRTLSSKTASLADSFKASIGPVRDYKGMWRDAVRAICIQMDMIAIERKLSIIQGIDDVTHISHTLDVVANLQARFQGKKERKRVKHLKLLQSEEFGQEYYEKIVVIQRLARQYLARGEMLRRLDSRVREQAVSNEWDATNTADRLRINPSLRKAFDWTDAPVSSNEPRESSAKDDAPPPRELTQENLRLKFERRNDLPAENGLLPQEFQLVEQALSTLSRVPNLPGHSPWQNETYAAQKMAEARDRHLYYYVVNGGHMANLEEEEEEGLAGGQSSSSHDSLYVAVRGILKENEKRALRLVRKRDKKSHEEGAP